MGVFLCRSGVQDMDWGVNRSGKGVRAFKSLQTQMFSYAGVVQKGMDFDKPLTISTFETLTNAASQSVGCHESSAGTGVKAGEMVARGAIPQSTHSGVSTTLQKRPPTASVNSR